MNDPGLENRILNDAQIIENQQQSDEREETEEDEQTFLAPTRWWFVSTAFPLIAGTFGPMASAFSICALAISWRVLVPSGSSETFGVYIDDPPWLVVINAVQLAIALVSNLFLLLNMAQRVKFSIAQPIAIIGWYISSFALVGLIAAVAGPIQSFSGQDTIFSQAFYYAIFSAGLYFIVASLMVATLIGAYSGHCNKEFKLTVSQRTLMLQTISFLVYLVGGAAVYAHIEGWHFLDAVYFADYTLLTIGIGDIAPSTYLGRGLLFPYAIGGIIILGIVIGSIQSLVLERGRIKLGERILEKERERILSKAWKEKRAFLTPIFEMGDGDGTGLTERERQQMEFNMMRKAQENAASRRRWTALAISATVWLALWFGGAVVFLATENATQQWSYFQALYFSYTSLLTIGYGDTYPVSNAGKSFFVFWSLLSVPSLTILISNMGDTIVKLIRDLTIWVGNITVLPGEHSAKASLKIAMRKITRNKIVLSKLEKEQPGILGELDTKGDRDDSDDGGAKGRRHKNDPEGTAQLPANSQAIIEADRAAEESKTGDEHAIPESRHHYHAMLIKEINNVMRHLKSNPPRKYSFDEWAWYLRLIGEYEASAKTRRQAVGKTDEKGSGRRGANTWSWVGNRSPLMGNKEEPEWVLERLTRTLERELMALRREEEEKKKKDSARKGAGFTTDGVEEEYADADIAVGLPSQGERKRIITIVK